MADAMKKAKGEQAESVYRRRFGGKAGDCPVTEYVSDRLLRLPFYNSLSEAEQERVITAIREFRL